MAEVTRTASPASSRHVAFDAKCQVIPEGDCNDLRKLLSLCPTRAQSPPIVGSSSRPASLIARTISPPFARAKSPQLRKASGLGQGTPSGSTSWKTRLTSWGSGVDSNTIAGSLSAAFGAPPNSSAPRLVAPVPARGTASPLIPFEDDSLADASPAKEESIDFDDVDAEFRQAVSGVAMQHHHHMPVERVHTASPLPGHERSSSPYIRAIANLRQQTPSPARPPPKSCLVRSKTPQAPRPPTLMDDGMRPLRATRSNDRDCCFERRRRAQGNPVVCPSPLSSPDDERYPWGGDAITPNENHPATKPAEKSKGSRWRRFRRAASEDASRSEPSSSSHNAHMDETAVKREIQAGRWPFEAPLNAECSCKNCQHTIEVGLASDYEPKWTRAARIRWLEAQEDAAAAAARGGNGTAVTASSGLPRSTSRTAIQADEMAQLHNETAHPMTQAELEAEPASPAVEQGELSWMGGGAREASGVQAKPPNPTGLEEGDDTLRREIMARRQKMARQSPVMRYGARSMMRQLEEAERIEQEAARTRSSSREDHRTTGSGRSSPATPAMSPSLPSTPDSVSNATQERSATEVAAAGQSYFDMPAPPERVRSPLVPAGAVSSPRFARPVAVPSTAFGMTNVAHALEAAVSESPPESPAEEQRPGKGQG